MKLAVLVLVLAAALLLGYVWYQRSRIPDASQPYTVINSSAILYSLPTISDAIPLAAHAAKPSPSAFRMHEDDWRQIEFVAVGALPTVERELEEIAAYKQINWKGGGWKSVYVRKSRPDALATEGISFEQLLASIQHGPVKDLMIGSAGQEALVVGGFVLPVAGDAWLYGNQQAGTVVTLALTWREVGTVRALGPSVRHLCTKFGLIIVDWLGGRVIANSQSVDTDTNDAKK